MMPMEERVYGYMKTLKKPITVKALAARFDRSIPAISLACRSLVFRGLVGIKMAKSPTTGRFCQAFWVLREPIDPKALPDAVELTDDPREVGKADLVGGFSRDFDFERSTGSKIIAKAVEKFKEKGGEDGVAYAKSTKRFRRVISELDGKPVNEEWDGQGRAPIPKRKARNFRHDWKKC
jgi:hypothetical protein